MWSTAETNPERRRVARVAEADHRPNPGGCAPRPAVASRIVSDRLTADDVAKVARLARLDLSPDEIIHATEQLGDMLEHFADIDALDLSDVQPMTQPYPLVNVMRSDDELPCLDRDEVMASAPQPEEGHFRVPPILGADP